VGFPDKLAVPIMVFSPSMYCRLAMNLAVGARFCKHLIRKTHKVLEWK